MAGHVPIDGYFVASARADKKARPRSNPGPYSNSVGEEAEGVDKHRVAERCGAIREHPLKEHKVAEGIAERRSFGCVERFHCFEEAAHAGDVSERGHLICRTSLERAREGCVDCSARLLICGDRVDGRRRNVLVA